VKLKLNLHGNEIEKKAVLITYFESHEIRSIFDMIIYSMKAKISLAQIINSANNKINENFK
jgi:hypothetical protein